MRVDAGKVLRAAITTEFQFQKREMSAASVKSLAFSNWKRGREGKNGRLIKTGEEEKKRRGRPV